MGEIGDEATAKKLANALLGKYGYVAKAPLALQQITVIRYGMSDTAPGIITYMGTPAQVSEAESMIADIVKSKDDAPEDDHGEMSDAETPVSARVAESSESPPLIRERRASIPATEQPPTTEWNSEGAKCDQVHPGGTAVKFMSDSAVNCQAA